MTMTGSMQITKTKIMKKGMNNNLMKTMKTMKMIKKMNTMMIGKIKIKLQIFSQGQQKMEMLVKVGI